MIAPYNFIENFIKNKIINIDELKCKICYESLWSNDKINCTTCGCRGSMSHIHDECILKYMIHQTNKELNLTCTVCNRKYELSRYLKIKYFLKNYKTDKEIRLMNKNREQTVNIIKLLFYFY